MHREWTTINNEESKGETIKDGWSLSISEIITTEPMEISNKVVY